MKTPKAVDSFAEIATAWITLQGADPPTTRKILHDIVQAAVGWIVYWTPRKTHGSKRLGVIPSPLSEFVTSGSTYGLPDDEGWRTVPREEAAKVRLRDARELGETVIACTCDFGDDWVQEIRITDGRQGEPGIDYPHYFASERNGTPEGCGTAAACPDSITSSTPAPILSAQSIRLLSPCSAATIPSAWLRVIHYERESRSSIRSIRLLAAT